jgi:adenine-specific DNA methylase
VQCEGPACGALIPLISQTILAKGKHKAWIEIKGDKATKKVSVEVKMGEKVPGNLKVTAGGGHAVCPVCDTTTHKDRVKAQGMAGKIGNRLFGIALPVGEREGKEYQTADLADQKAFDLASKAWEKVVKEKPDAVITEKYPFHDPRAFTAGQYGILTWGDLFSMRQMLALYTLGELVQEYKTKILKEGTEKILARDTAAALGLGVSNAVHYNTNVSTWLAEHMISSFITGNAMAMRWDWAEANPLVGSYVGGIDFSFKKGLDALHVVASGKQGNEATVLRQNAAALNLPDDSADLFFSDPPYYDVVPYADLSDLCFVWLKRFLHNDFPDLFSENLTPKADQIVVNPYAVADGRGEQSPERYRERMTQAFIEGHRALKPDAIGCVVFAHKGTSAWETLLASIVDAGFVVTASWPIDTERASRMRANDSAALQTSVHLIVRPRENPDGTLRNDAIGDWRDVLRELPPRIKTWMKRMSDEGVAGADAIFACLGPALEIFSRYNRVEKPNGDVVSLREYMIKVWETVSREALAMLFDDAETQGFESDARVTAIWLWTMASEAPAPASKNAKPDTDEDETEDTGSGGKTKAKGGFSLDSDTANRIAQSLGADIHDLSDVIEVKGDKSRLITVRERMDKLFKSKEKEDKKAAKRKKKDDSQTSLFDEWELQGAEQAETPLSYEKGTSVLDQLHQAMLFFALGRTAILRKFLTEDGAGRDERFWKLAQALNALYPQNTEERRWLEGVQAYKKSLGL